MSVNHKTQLTTLLQELAAKFVNLESNKTSLITITRAEMNEMLDRITFYVDVFPDSAEDVAIGFLMRKRGACRAYIKAHASIQRIPHVEFALDEGEKKRRRVDALLQQ